ncbi:squalene/phytoene synthase family protein [Metabacillus arenae]|uniref:Phytoene/squalene synthase family protein n=1 Tax=Metabacillus arenae TaxID=2771434 RepID=A0A926NK66_9BACI|nr:phytoene/squalene synthase family protein [Metabacillus arenae]MBD1379572.1 phytoene/squalene synthase family protein [Metabacillus arenae]
MTSATKLHREATEMLLETSRTFIIPISHLSPGLQEAVTSAYLCMRAIDEIEDHRILEKEAKNHLLRSISTLLKKEPFNHTALSNLLTPYQKQLPEVSLRLSDWITLCPPGASREVLNATAIMAEGMADWVLKDWKIESEQDLNDYTYYVAGLVGVMLSHIWKWYDGTETDEKLAIGFGRGLQSVNILRNRKEDLERGEVDFFPNDWDFDDMFEYARKNLALADAYIEDIETTSILNFCKIPLALAHGTLNALNNGKEKISRADVTEIVKQAVEES